MKNPFTTKITDIKFALKRLENSCNKQQYADACKLLQRAITILEQAEKSADITPDNTEKPKR
jgi:hypothetical protein